MICETKMRTLAAADPALQAIFGYPIFRWNMFGQLEQGYIERGTCARIRRISSISNYVQEGPLNLEMIRFQFDFMDYDPVKTFAAADAVGKWMTTVDFMSNVQFLSPPGTPRQFPNFQVNQRSGIEATPSKQIYVQSVDWKIMNASDL